MREGGKGQEARRGDWTAGPTPEPAVGPAEVGHFERDEAAVGKRAAGRRGQRRKRS